MSARFGAWEKAVREATRGITGADTRSVYPASFAMECNDNIALASRQEACRASPPVWPRPIYVAMVSSVWHEIEAT